MDKAEKAHLDEIKRIETALEKTNSPFLKRDYEKCLKRLKKELKEYRRYRYGKTEN